jgi:hypothetical protein
MSNFLTSVVRRGAGLPLPVSIRPATGPQQIAAAIPISLPAADFESPRAPIAPAPRTRPEATCEPLERVVPPSDQPETPPPPARLDVGNSGASGPPQPVIVPREVDRSGVGAGTTIDRSSEPGERIAPLVETRPSIVPLAGPPSREAGPPVATAVVAPHPAVSRGSKPGTEQPVGRAGPEDRSIHVKIGRVEIRSTQPAPVTRSQRQNENRGFEDLKFARTYVDRSSR